MAVVILARTINIASIEQHKQTKKKHNQQQNKLTQQRKAIRFSGEKKLCAQIGILKIL